VLCALVFRRRQWVSASNLLDSLYEESAPASGVGVIQTHVAALRRVLEPGRKPRTPPTVLLSGHGGYQLWIGDEQTDLGDFDRLVADAERARDHADWTGADQAYARALRLYGGEPLAGIPGPYAEMWRTSLAERHLAVLEDGLDVALTLGQYDTVIDRLRLLTAEHPLRERPRALLMRALHLSGRQSDALDVYARTRRLLVDELGVDPGHELRTLHSRILSGEPPETTEAAPRTTPRAAPRTATGDAEAAPPAPWAPPTPPTPSAVGSSAPEAPSPTPSRESLVADREDELARVVAWAGQAAAGEGGLVTVSGITGHGKSRFLDETARRIPGTRRVNLGPAAAEDTPLALVNGILAGLGLGLDPDPGLGLGLGQGQGMSLDPDLAPSSAGDSAHDAASRAGRTDHDQAALIRRALDGLAAEGPVVVLVDSVRFVDERSQRIVTALAPYLRTSRVLLVLALDERPWDPATACWHAAVEGAASDVLRLSRLSEAAVAELVAARLPRLPRHEGLAEEVFRATAGVPVLVDALIRDLSALRGPTRVPERLPDGGFARALRHLIDPFPPAARIVRALAVLHDQRPDGEILAAACGDSVTTVRDWCAYLTEGNVLSTDDPPTFRHPLWTHALRGQVTPEETARIRTAAAHHARISGRTARQTAGYLDDLTGPRWSQWTGVLVDAAGECLRHNLVQEALRHLQAALRVAAPEERDGILVQLGMLELWVNPAASLAHLDEALKEQRAAGKPPTAVIPLAWTMSSHRQAQAAFALTGEVIAETERRDPATAKAIRASAWMAFALTHETWAAFMRQLRTAPGDGDGDGTGTGTGDPIAAAALTWDDAFNVRCSAQEAMARFPSEGNEDRAWEKLPREVVGILNHIAMWSEDLTLAAQLSEQNEDYHFGTLDIYRRVLHSEVLMRQGDFEGALKECAPVAGLALDEVPQRPTALVAQYANALLGLGRVDEAERWLDSVTGHANPQTWDWTIVKYRRALVHSARGQAREAAAHFLDCGRRNAAWGLNNPAHIPWRSYAAMELVKIGEHERARELAAAELALAQRWNTPQTVGRAWRAVALTSPEAVSLPLLEQAVGHLRRGEALAELVRALADLARACARTGDTRRAHELLREARGLAASRSMILLLGEIDAQLEGLPRLP
jgi:DNA-binding SARP family transcriptional activator/tetratricopeptide (TPR) repeat protein